MYINTTGLILRETPYKESSKILTVLTSSHGRLTVTAHGALRKNSKIAAVTQLLTFSEMTLFQKKDRWTLTEARCIEQFIGLREHLESLALGAYFAQLAEAVSDEDSPSAQLLPLCLNALFALSEQLNERELIKPAFELRLMAISGFAPLIDHCYICHDQNPNRVYLDIAGGTITCERCGGGSGHSLGLGALHAMRYIISCDGKKLFSFTLGDAAKKQLKAATEGYLLAHLDRNFRTLEYYKGISL